MKVYNAFKDGGANLQMVPAVRDPNGKCVDEPKPGCPWERVTLCAFDGQSLGAQVAFLDCMDSPWSHLLHWKDPPRCAKQAGLSWPKISQCYNSTRGDQLLEEASKVFTAQYPKLVPLPESAVNGESVDADYDSIRKAACAAGSSSSVC